MSPVYSDRMKAFMSFDLGTLDLDSLPVEALDVPYMEEGRFTYDLYRESSEKISPLIIVIHGGGWVSGKPRSKFMKPMIQPAYHGVTIAVLSYTLALEAPFPSSVNGIKTAIRYFRANAKALRIDPNKIYLWGESAGANVAALVGLTVNTDLHDLSQGYAETSEDIAGVIGHYGVYNLFTLNEQSKALGLEDDWDMNDDDHYMTFWLGQPMNQDFQWTSKANPNSYIDQAKIPFYLVHGLSDTMVPWLQTQEFAQKLCERKDISVVTDYVAQAEHADPLAFNPTVISRIVAFVKG